MDLSDYYAVSFQIPFFWLIVGGTLGVCVGSFINAAAYRIPAKKSLMTGSACPKCDSVIMPYDNIPVLSYLFLRGKCRGCKTPISLQYPMIELLGGFFGLFWVGWLNIYGLPYLTIALLSLYKYAVYLTYGETFKPS